MCTQPQAFTPCLSHNGGVLVISSATALPLPLYTDLWAKLQPLGWLPGPAQTCPAITQPDPGNDPWVDLQLDSRPASTPQCCFMVWLLGCTKLHTAQPWAPMSWTCLQAPVPSLGRCLMAGAALVPHSSPASGWNGGWSCSPLGSPCPG